MILKIGLFLILLLPAAGLAAETWSQRFQSEPAGSKFSAAETTLDLFGSIHVPEHQDIFDGRLGIGIGGNHFFSQYIGVGADTSVDKFDWPNHFNASLFGRYPIEKWSLAPYAFTGVGRQFHDTSQWTFHFGGGVDYRLNQKTGLFLDIRRTWAEESRDFTLWRLGVRLGF